MQAAFAPLPKLPLVGHQSVATPVRWPWRIEHELRRVLGRIGDENRATFNDLALG